jgi:hypothetical protein
MEWWYCRLSMLKERGTQGLGEWLKKLAEREH